MPPKDEPVEAEASEENVVGRAQLDFVNDLNEEFFGEAFKIVQNLAEDNQMETAAEFKKYVTILHELHVKYLDGVNEINEMKPKLIEADDKLRLAIKLSGDSKDAMTNLKLALETAWRDTDASRTREQGFQEQLRELFMKCESMTKKETDENQDDNAEFGHLAKYKHIILKERDRLHTEVMELERRVQMQRIYIESLEKVWQNLEEINEKTNKKIEVLETEKTNLEKRLRQLKDVFEELKDVNRNLLLKTSAQGKHINELQNVNNEKNREIDRLRISFEKTKSDYTMLMKNVIKMKSDYQLLMNDKKTLQEQYKDLKNDNKDKQDRLIQMNKKLKKCNSDYDSLSSRVYQMNKLIHSLKEDIMRLKTSGNNLEKSLIELASKYENMKRLKDYVTHERDCLRADILKLNNIINELKSSNAQKTNFIDSLQMEIKKYQVRIEEANKAILRAEKERDEQIQEVQMLQDKIVNLQELIQLKTDQLATLNENLANKQRAYVKIQKLLEATNSERLMLQRSLQSCSEERTTLKGLLAKATHQITQLTEEISANQNKISQLNLLIEHIRNEKKELETELRTTKNTLKNTRQELKDMKQKNDSLMKTVHEDELRFLKLTVQLDDVRKEKNLIGLQLVRRNDEIILLREKLTIFQDALDKGQMQYNQRIEDIRLLKIEVSNLQTTREVLKKGLKSTANMREEVVRLQCSLNQEKIRNRCLTEDLKTPANVHRWRILGGTDPDRFALTEKVQVLQKQILKQQMQAIKKEKDLQDSHQLYLSVKTYMEKLPSYKLKRDYLTNQSRLRHKERKMKALAAELMTKELDVKTRDCEVNELKSSLVVLKKSLFTERKICSKLRQKKCPLPSTKNCCPCENPPDEGRTM